MDRTARHARKLKHRRVIASAQARPAVAQVGPQRVGSGFPDHGLAQYLASNPVLAVHPAPIDRFSERHDPIVGIDITATDRPRQHMPGHPVGTTEFPQNRHQGLVGINPLPVKPVTQLRLKLVPIK